MKHRFPIFKKHPELVYLDSASTTQRVDSALEAAEAYHLDFNANVHRGLYPFSETATEAYEAARERVAQFLGTEHPSSIVFTRGTTESINLVAQSWGRTQLKPGDEILISEMEHHSNLIPWQEIAKETGAVLKFIPVMGLGDLDYDAFENLLNKKTALIAITGLSNTLGTLVQIEQIISSAKSIGARVLLDAAQLVAHCPIDLSQTPVDFLAFSGHKIYGLTGTGVLYINPELIDEMPPVQTGGSMIKSVALEGSTWAPAPQKFEAGTPHIAGVLGLAAAIDFIESVSWEKIQAHDRHLMDYARQQLNEIKGLTLLGPQNSDHHLGALSFTLKDIHPHDVAALLGESGVCVRAGHHCTMPLMQKLEVVATTRASFGIYNEKADVDKLVEGLLKVGDLL